eukprot:CAMPEP_0185022322 /NCGR_PEP_ID=MMETSP1103-20130426/5032_1 /TAXON_ID=36769 /ORGANISM="Paraphysomonas bandaiensis, Strain Caron Lab Isolate" /LENGTH=906 /DNA_ID=CAMNT_0027554333 /DNA_START=389 /DNA_END=3109 /DNA_ORIENTATION=+
MNDFTKLAPMVLRFAVKKGYMVKQGTVNKYSMKRRYFALLGCMLFYFESEEPESCIGFVFTECCVCDNSQSSDSPKKESGYDESFMFTICTVSGKRVTLFAISSEERDSWIAAIESNTCMALSQRTEDLDFISSQTSQRLELAESDLTRAILARETLQREMDSIIRENMMLQNRIDILEKNLKETTSRLDSSESERRLLLSASGVVPKVLPSWSLSNSVARIWVGSWNMGASDPVSLGSGSPSLASTISRVQSFAPPGYDIYCVGVQECISETLFDALDSALAPSGVRRIRLDSQFGSDVARYYFKEGDGAAAGSSSALQEAISSDPSKLCGRGDGSLLSLKYTGVALYVHERLMPVTRVVAVSRRPFSPIHSKGGVGAVLSVAGRTVAFLTCHLEAHKNDIRREQYREIVGCLGSQLGEDGFHLCEQFHHVIWCGDMNYRLVEESGGASLPSTTALRLLEERQNRKLFETHDQLNQEKRAQEVFYGFREPEPFPNFFPTYKKIERRPPVDPYDSGWARATYRVKYKEPFYKGGMVKERTPGFCDRILYHSITDLAENLVPERVRLDLSLEQNTAQSLSLNKKHESERTLSHVVDNYQSVNGGDPWNMSDHSPVFATFLLRLFEDETNHTDNDKTDSRNEYGKESDRSVGEHNNSSLLTPYSTSILPRGVYRIVLTDIKVVWGSMEELPCTVDLLFPLPFEVTNGENFADYISNGRHSSQSVRTPSADSSGSDDLDDNVMSSPDSKSRAHNLGSRVRRTILGWHSSETATHTCLALHYNNTVAALSGKRDIDPIEIIWRGSTPVDRLHLALRVGVDSAVIIHSRPSVRASNASGADMSDRMIGHCTLDLSRVCKTAAASDSGVRGSVSMARQLIKDGVPMYNIDVVSMQREVVTFYCSMEIMPHSD